MPLAKIDTRRDSFFFVFSVAISRDAKLGKNIQREEVEEVEETERRRDKSKKFDLHCKVVNLGATLVA